MWIFAWESEFPGWRVSYATSMINGRFTVGCGSVRLDQDHGISPEKRRRRQAVGSRHDT